MKTKDFIQKNKAKSEKELATLVAEKRVSLREFRFAVAGSKTKNIKEGRTLRRDIARALTFLKTNAETK